MSTENLTLSSTTDTPEVTNAEYRAHREAGGGTLPVKKADGDEPKGDEDDESETPNGADTSEKPAGEKKAKGGFQKRIDKLTAERFRLDAENKILREQLAAGIKPAEKPEEKKPAAPASDKEPVPEDFTTYELYIKALARYEHKQLAAEEKQKTQQTQQETARAALIEQHTERIVTAREKYSDFDEVTDQELPISQAMQDVIFESETGAELAYWLGKNPDECKRISRLTPTAAARELGKIEAQLGTTESAEKTETPKPKVTSAPAPIKPVGAKASAGKKDPKDMNLAEYRAYREAGGGK